MPQLSFFAATSEEGRWRRMKGPIEPALQIKHSRCVLCAGPIQHGAPRFNGVPKPDWPRATGASSGGTAVVRGVPSIFR